MATFNEEISKLFEKINNTFDTKMCVGEPIKINETTIVPFVEMTMGAGIGGLSSNDNKAGGFGAKMSPVACLIIQNGFTKVINIKNQDAISKALDMIPDIVDKLTGKKLPDEIEDAIDNMDDEYIENV